MKAKHSKEREVFWQLSLGIPILFFVLSAGWAMSRDWSSKGLRNLSFLNTGIGIPIGFVSGAWASKAVKDGKKEVELSQEAMNFLPEDKQRLLKEAERLEGMGIKLEELVK